MNNETPNENSDSRENVADVLSTTNAPSDHAQDVNDETRVYSPENGAENRRNNTALPDGSGNAAQGDGSGNTPQGDDSGNTPQAGGSGNSSTNSTWETVTSVAKNYPGATIAGVAVLGAVAMVAAAPTIIAGVGFGSSGVVGGSIAAGIQSAIGNVAAGSAFATLQSVGATGVLTAGVVSTAAGSGAVVAGSAAAGGVYMLNSNKKEGEKDKKEPASDSNERPRGAETSAVTPDTALAGQEHTQPQEVNHTESASDIFPGLNADNYMRYS